MTDKPDGKRRGQWLVPAVLLAAVSAATLYWVARPRVSSLSPRPVVNLSTEEAEILTIAKKELSARKELTDGLEFQRPQRNADGSWAVFVSTVPPIPGGHFTMVIEERHVVKILPGA